MILKLFSPQTARGQYNVLCSVLNATCWVKVTRKYRPINCVLFFSMIEKCCCGSNTDSITLSWILKTRIQTDGWMVLYFSVFCSPSHALVNYSGRHANTMASNSGTETRPAANRFNWPPAWGVMLDSTSGCFWLIHLHKGCLFSCSELMKLTTFLPNFKWTESVWSAKISVTQSP